MKNEMNKHWLKEPLVHFLIAGAVLFAIDAQLNQDSSAEVCDSVDGRVLHLGLAEVNQLKDTRTQRLNAPPKENELRSLVRNYLFEKLLAAEARAQGLANDDPVIQRHLADKMEFLVNDTEHPTQPSEEDLRRLYQAEPELFQIPARITFDQIFFRSEANAQQALNKVKKKGDEALATPHLMKTEIRLMDKQTLGQQLGQSFAQAVFSSEPGRWLGPVASRLGFHLVRLKEIEPAKSSSYEEAHSKVLKVWQMRQQVRIRQEYFKGLLRKYKVVMDDSVNRLMGPHWLTAQ
jgi:parvulin-like peptidyl-prolyl isomerase